MSHKKREGKMSLYGNAQAPKAGLKERARAIYEGLRPPYDEKEREAVKEYEREVKAEFEAERKRRDERKAANRARAEESRERARAARLRREEALRRHPLMDVAAFTFWPFAKDAEARRKCEDATREYTAKDAAKLRKLAAEMLEVQARIEDAEDAASLALGRCVATSGLPSTAVRSLKNWLDK